MNMPENITAPVSPKHNMDILRQGEYGHALREVYKTAVTLDPRLEDVEFVPLPEESPSVARACPAWLSESGKHQVHINLANVEDTLGKLTETIDAIPGARELFADQISVEPDQLTSEVLLLHAFSHELGHIREYIDYEDDPKALDRRMKTEKEALPIGQATVSTMMKEGSSANEYVKSKWTLISDHLGINTLGELYEMQHVSYRNMTSEKLADDFAAQVLTLNPVLVDQLTGPNRAEYRDLPLEVYG